ncbi:MAG: IreB family regulatory phosphoprotein [Bacilli bacterium]|nr:IreB family regulatory phosphoprotein [Bacilli bacterium]
MVDNKTTIFNVQELRQELILMTINEVVEALEFKGYNPTSQLVGFLTTGDEKYITTFNDSRKKLCRFEREEIMMAFVNSYLGRM